MTDARAELRRLGLLVAALVVIDVGGAYALDAASLVEVLLAPPTWRTLVALPVALVFFAARIALFFAAPGLLVGGAAVAWLERRDRGA